MSLFDEILDENRPPPTYDYPEEDDIKEDDDNNICEDRAASSGEKDTNSCGSEVVELSASSLLPPGNGLNDRDVGDDLRVNDDLRTRLIQRSAMQGVACPRSSSRPSSREGRPASAASSGEDRPKSNGSSSGGEHSARSLSKQVQRLAKLGVQLNKAPKLGAGTGVVDLLLPDEVSEKTQKSSALDRWFMSKFELKRKTANECPRPAPISCSSNMAVKDETGATVIEKKVIVLNQSQHGQRQPMRGIQGSKIIKGQLEAALAKKRQAGLQQRKEWFEEDNPKSDADESEAELTDGDEAEQDDGRSSSLSDDGDDRPSPTNEFVDDEAIEEDGDDDVQETSPGIDDEPAGQDESDEAVDAGTQPFCLQLEEEPDTLKMDDDELAADVSPAEQNAAVDGNKRRDTGVVSLVKKQMSTADFFDDDDGDEVPGTAQKQSSIQPTFLRPTSPTPAKEDSSKQHSTSFAPAPTEFPMLGCSTPARPSHSKQSDGMAFASHESLENADSQGFMSVDLHLPESLSQWAPDTSNDASLISNQAGDVTNEEVLNTDVDSAPSQLIGLCSGKFSTNSLPPAAASDDAAHTSSVDSDLLGLCSGLFPDADATQHPPATSLRTDRIVSEPIKMADTNDDLDNLSDASDEKTIDGYESNKSKSSTSSTKQRKKVLIKRRRKRAVLSDSEDEEDDNVESATNDGNKAASDVNDDRSEADAEEARSGEEEDEDEEEEEGDNADADDARNGSDDEVAVFRRLQQAADKRTSLFDKDKKLRRDFYDEEAELSGSDIGSGDEDLGSDQDVYEAEEGDLDEVPDEDELRVQVNRAFLKQQHDDDKRNVLLYQDALLPDGDLHDDGDRNRRFRWRQREEEDALTLALDNDLPAVGEQMDVDVAVEDIDAGRVQLIKWRASHDGADDDSNDEAEHDSQLLKMGQIAIQRQMSSHSVDVSVAVASSKAIVGGTSFLKRDATTLSLLSKGTAQTGATNAKTAANSLFSCIAADTSGVKRPATDSDQSKQSVAVKRPKPSSSDSIFRHFVN